jgi:hydrogenase expression/formation protein HypE
VSDERIRLAHGAGGPAMRELVSRVFLAGGSDEARRMDDGAVIPFGDRFLVVSCDAHVVQPRVFPGGDLGRLAVCGTVNDLAVMGATEVLGLTTTFVVEEGFPIAELAAIRASMAAAAAEAGAPLLAGDLKVMRAGEVDGVVTSTSGVGVADAVVRSDGLRPGDVLLVSGTLGDHGLTVLATRHALGLSGDLRSDVAPLNGLVAAALRAGGVRAMKDATRGGLAAALVELSTASRVGVVLDEAALPVSPAARAAAELLGIDPLVVANEGKVVLGVSPEAADAVLAALRAHPYGRDAAVVGRVVAGRAEVVLDTGFGTRRVREPDADPLPRIC